MPAEYVGQRKLCLGRMPLDGRADEWLAAGPFCFAGQEEKFPGWEKDFVFAPEPLANAEVLQFAAKSAQALAMSALAPMAARLGGSLDKPGPLYWQILLMPWLIDICRQLVERSLRCKAMLDCWGTLPLKVPLLPSECEFDFQDEHDFTLRGNLGSDFNHWLFSRLLEARWPEAWQKEYLAGVDTTCAGKSAKPDPVRNFYLAARQMAAKMFLGLSFPRLKGMGLWQALRYSLALAHPCRQADESLDLERDFARPELVSRLELPENVLEIIGESIPQSIRRLKHPVSTGTRSASPHLRLVHISAYEDARYRQRLAIWRNQGNRLAWAQHGGNYGQVRICCEAEIVEYSQDVFFTWGWERQGGAKGHFRRMPYPQLQAMANKWHGGQEAIIFVGTEMAAYAYRLDSHPTPLQYLAYREDKAKFLGGLNREIIEKILYRPYFDVPGTLADAGWLLPRFPAVGLCGGNLSPRLLNCALLILDHHGTTLLEAMAANTPMLLFWNRQYWQLCPECARLLDLLESAGIWQPDPEAAARKLNEIWPDCREWWGQKTIQAARREFMENQAWIFAGDVNSLWIKTLREL